MIDCIVDGIIESFTPEQVDIYFVLDHPTDGTAERIYKACQISLKAFDTTTFHTQTETFKFPCQNRILNRVVDMNYKAAICPQDDQKITDKKLIGNINNVFNIYGDKLGVIGLRDGFRMNYADMVSSEWSESTMTKAPRLGNGVFAERPLLNDGGLIYFQHVINKVGLHDVNSYERFYIEDDYCARSNNAGLKNIVMGNSLIHDRTISGVTSTNYDNDRPARDAKTFKDRWANNIK